LSPEKLAAQACALLLLPAAALAGWADFDRVRPEEIAARRNVSIVYADQNLRSPASMFGHTFLVFHDELEPESDAPVLEFLGEANTAGAEVRAVFVGISGRFRLSRFVFVQRTYDLEDRSLFVYTLRLGLSERRRLDDVARDALRDTWHYDFFRENCSYQLLGLLLRSLDPAHGFGSFPFVLPASTVRFLERHGRVERSFPLSSSLDRLERLYAGLSAAQRGEFHLLASGARPTSSQVDPLVAESVRAFVRYRAPREPDANRRIALFESAAALASSGATGHAGEAGPAARDPGQMRPSVIGLGWRAIESGGLATLTLLPAVRAFENAVDDGLKNSSLEVARLGLFYRPGWFGVYEFRAVHLDAEQAGSRLGDGFTRYLDASFEKSPNLDWSLHDEYRAHFGGGLTVGRGALTLSVVIFTGPRYAVSASNRLLLWDVGLKGAVHVWLGNTLHLRSEMKWVPLAPGDDQGLWSNLAALALGPISLVGGTESPSGNVLKLRAVTGANLAF